MVASTINRFEECVRHISNERGVRISENFIDFDNLRSGKVTEDQFFRIISKNLGIQINDEHKALIRQKYGCEDRISWREFVKNIDKIIDAQNLVVKPEDQMRRIRLQESTCSPKTILNENESFRPILSRISQFIRYQGYSIREQYKDFDPQNIGKVSESQFFRNFPSNNVITEAELCALARRYSVPKDPGMVDYRRFEEDLRQLAYAEHAANDGFPPKLEAPDKPMTSKEELNIPSVHMILERIGFAVHSCGIRVLDFFTDYDPLRHDEVSEHQFACALNLSLSKTANLTRFDIQKLANFFRSNKNSDKISYREFCQAVDFPFHKMNLEKNPLEIPMMPPCGALSRPLKSLNEDDELRCSNILRRLHEKVRTERIQTYAFFRDYDVSTALTRTMTPMQMGRALHFLNLKISSEDCRLLAKKFADPFTGNVNYAALCEAIDPMFEASASVKQVKINNLETESIKQPLKIGEFFTNQAQCDWDAFSIPNAKSVGDSVPVDVLMSRIRHLILINRIQLKSFFEDFDLLRSGRMNRDRFFRALCNAGLNRIDLHDLTLIQMKRIADRFSCPDDPTMVRWLDFVDEVNTVFTLPELEKKPLARVPPSEIFLLPKPGTGDWRCATEEMKNNYDRGMRALRRFVTERRLQIKPEFQAFDKLNRGHVTLTNFQQLLSMLNYHLDKETIDAVSARYADDEGFNYAAFLSDLDPSTKEQKHYEYPERIEKIRKYNVYAKKQNESQPVLRDAEAVLDHIKNEVYHRRIRLSEWFRDHDQLNHGTISKQAFRRTLGLLPVDLKETELNVLEHYFKDSERNMIKWRAFCEEIESIFATQNLEKDPLKEGHTYQSESRVSQNYLPIDLASQADAAVKKIGNRVCQRRIQLTPLFSDFDVTHRMTLSQSQFRRCIMTLGLADLVTEHEWNALYAKYRHPVGNIDNINYLAFSDDVYEVAGMVYRTP